MFRKMRNTQCTSRAYTHRAFANTFHANENGNGPWKLEIVWFSQIVSMRQWRIGGIIWHFYLLLAVLPVAHKIPVEGEMSSVKLNR